MKMLDFDDVLIQPDIQNVSSRKDVNLNIEYTFKHYKPHPLHKPYNGIPIMAANMDGIGTIAMAEKLATYNMFICLTKTIDQDVLIDWITNTGYSINNNWAYSMGISDADYKKFKHVYNMTNFGIKFVCMDVANGYMTKFHNFVKHIRNEYPHVVIIAGNVTTQSGVAALYEAGADVCKLGIGGGQQCTSRKKTGVGTPQFSTILDCVQYYKNFQGNKPLLISDGGCVNPGDVAKAFVGGADFVMLGSMLSGTDQSGFDIIEKLEHSGEYSYSNYEYKPIINRNKYIISYGMSSKTANEKHFGGLKDYRTSEGRTVLKPYIGDVSTVVIDILGGLRSSCTYTGCGDIRTFKSGGVVWKECNSTHSRAFEKHTIGE